MENTSFLLVHNTMLWYMFGTGKITQRYLIIKKILTDVNETTKNIRNPIEKSNTKSFSTFVLRLRLIKYQRKFGRCHLLRMAIISLQQEIDMLSSGILNIPGDSIR